MIYLDNAALQCPKQEIIDVVMNVLQNQWYNANSVYDTGLESRRLIEIARLTIAKEINCNSDELIFCSSGSEANTLAIDGYLKANKKNKRIFIAGCLEHDSILMNNKLLKTIKCDKNGFYNLNEIEKLHNCLVSLQLANSEIGTIQNIAQISNILHKNNCILHIDAVQAFGHIRIDIKQLNIDMMTITGQKLGSILGASALYIKNGIKINSIIYGHQENNKRGGTYNTPAIATFGKAVELIDYDIEKEVQNKRDYLIDKLLSIDGIKLNGSKEKRLPNNINICFKNTGTKLDSQQMVATLDLTGGYCCSSGSACSAGLKEPSHVLKSIGLSDEEANSSLRITLSNDNTYQELDKFYNDFKNIIEQFK